MVGERLMLAAFASFELFLADESKKPPILRMSGEMRARVLAVITGLILLGLLLMVLAWLGARMTRRYMNQGRRGSVSSKPTPDDWANKPLVEPWDGETNDAPPHNEDA